MTEQHRPDELDVSEQGQPYPNPDEVDTIEFDPIVVEQPEPSLLKKAGNLVLRGMVAMGQGYAAGHVAYGAGYHVAPEQRKPEGPPPRPPKAPETDEDDDTNIFRGQD